MQRESMGSDGPGAYLDGKSATEGIRRRRRRLTSGLGGSAGPLRMCMGTEFHRRPSCMSVGCALPSGGGGMALDRLSR